MNIIRLYVGQLTQAVVRMALFCDIFELFGIELILYVLWPWNLC